MESFQGGPPIGSQDHSLSLGRESHGKIYTRGFSLGCFWEVFKYSKASEKHLLETAGSSFSEKKKQFTGLSLFPGVLFSEIRHVVELLGIPSCDEGVFC